VPISRNNKKAGVDVFPRYLYNGTVIITKDTVDDFVAKNIPQFPTQLYH
jgi:hypothetical protein